MIKIIILIIMIIMMIMIILIIINSLRLRSHDPIISILIIAIVIILIMMIITINSLREKMNNQAEWTQDSRCTGRETPALNFQPERSQKLYFRPDRKL